MTSTAQPEKLKFVRLEDRRIIEGVNDNMMKVSPCKYDKPIRRLEKMIHDQWTHFDVEMVVDRSHYEAATPKLQLAIQRALGFLSNLDGIQLSTLATSIGQHVTTPEYIFAITEQTRQEMIHCLTYGRIVDTLGMDPDATYSLYRTNPLLADKNEHVLRLTSLLRDSYSPENFVRAIAGNIVIEKIMFNSGFRLFFSQNRNGGKFPGVANNIRYIARDETEHTYLFSDMWHDLKAERPELFTAEVLEDCRQIIKTGALLEIQWGLHIADGGLPGFTPEIVEGGTKFLANEGCDLLSLARVFPEVTKDTMPWINDYMGQHGIVIESNFFEKAKVLDYQDKGLEWD